MFYTWTEFRTLAGLRFGGGNGGSAQSGGGRGGGPLASIGILFLIVKFCGLEWPFERWVKGDLRDCIAGEARLLSVSLDAAEGVVWLGDRRGDLAEFAEGEGDSIIGELETGCICKLVGRRRLGFADARMGT